MMTSEDKKNEARTFYVETRFQQLARRPGGIPREQAIERAQAQIEEVKPSFNEWLDGELTQLLALTKKAAAGETSGTAWADSAALHSRRIRDVGTTMGFDLLTFVCNNLSEMFEAIATGAEYRADLVDLHIEALLLARQERYRNLRPDQLPELSGGLRRVLERVSTVPGGASE